MPWKARRGFEPPVGLGRACIAATRDRREIRRAYARELKQINSEQDPNGFQALRAAYEGALAMASSGAGAQAAESAPIGIPPPLDLPDASELGPSPQPVFGAPETIGVGAEETELLQQSLENLARMAAAPHADPDQLVTAFDAAMQSPALESIEVRERIERWCAAFLLQNNGNTDALIGRAIATFGWDRGHRPPHGLPAAVVARQEELYFLRGLSSRTSRLARAWRALDQPPTLLHQIRYRSDIRLFREMRALLEIIDHQHPALIAKCDGRAAAWWRRMLGEPGFGPEFVRLTAVTIIIAALALTASHLFGPPSTASLLISLGASLLVGPAIATAALLGLVRPRSRWRARDREGDSSWRRYGWVGLAPFLAASEALPTTGPVLTALAVLIGVGGCWAWMTADPDPNTQWRIRIYFVPVPITPTVLRALGALPILLACWVLKDTGAAAMSVLGLTCLYAIGGGTLQNAWRRRLVPRAQGGGLILLTVLAAVTPLALWWADGSERFFGLALGWTDLLYLMGLIVCTGLQGALRTARILWVRLGLIFTVGLAAQDQSQGQLDLLTLGFWLLIALVIGTLGVLRQDRAAIRAAFARAG